MKNYKAEKGNRTEWWTWMTICIILTSSTYLWPAIPVCYGLASVRRIGHIGLCRAWVFLWLPIVAAFPIGLLRLDIPGFIITPLWLALFVIIPGCIAGKDQDLPPLPPIPKL